MDFKDKVVIITGASSGIGLACAKKFIQLGSKLVLASRSEEKISSLANELSCNGSSCIAVRTDVTIEADCKRMVEKSIEEYGRIDILVSNAGISMRALFEDVDIEVLQRVMNVNFWGTVYCTKYALPHIQKSKGVVVGISSIAGFHGLPGRSAYSASKAAMQSFMESLRIENKTYGVKVLVLSAGFTSSNIRKSALGAHGKPQGETPLHEEKLASPELVANNLIRALNRRKRNRIMTLEGQLMVFFLPILPKIIDWNIHRIFKNLPNSLIK